MADDYLSRAGLAALLEAQAGATVVGQVAGEAGLSSSLDVYRPEIVVWDMGWDPTLALEHLAELEGAHPPVIALLPDDAHASEAWAAGARCILLRDSDARSLLAAMMAVAQGLLVLDSRLPVQVPSTSDQTQPPVMGDLTRREQEVLHLVAEGMPNKSIAQQLSISEHTVKFHVNSIMGKLGAQSRTEAVTRATRLGLLLLERLGRAIAYLAFLPGASLTIWAVCGRLIRLTVLIRDGIPNHQMDGQHWLLVKGRQNNGGNSTESVGCFGRDS